mgnify:CR=1 FL=1
MNGLQIFTKQVPVLDSREVAEMVGKAHGHLCRDIAKYVTVISTNPELDSLKFFVERNYVDGKGETRKRYDITKQGCEMVANKLTGEKGILFTAEYVKRFNEMESPDSYMIEDPIQRAKAWIKEREQYNTALATVKSQRQLIGELKPKADYTDKILASKGTVPITAIAKDYGMSGRAMNKVLADLKIIYQMAGQWLLYSRYQAKGYTHSKSFAFNHADGRPDVKMTTEWTQKGRLFLYQKLKKHGILPMIEQ